MIDLLMNNEAILGSRDLSGGIIKWSHCDEGTNSSLVLACQGGHTRLALRLLDEIDVEEYARQNDPFHVLEAAISTDDEIHAMAIAEHPKAAIRHNMSELLRRGTLLTD
ncbi:uncharacterized protein PITG_13633 [Phytophthora infestans T30-4]|uniref:Ankyrin repeat protein n=1 Tax=Phytophthora infestans (strain T30-4) TaxID=403677 RepID=D0NMF9_PHYIT|nr:uncharacterized protein PITG_13633 [Phytophthora infestans T30-4]EEY60880.1 hypothetical protein PITG_13633 [Phytophthora infestans T30-4]|eukprot:XP_002899826.1 hypothetical protein PITG_13633 [Phytophthora infestans T30-4]